MTNRKIVDETEVLRWFDEGKTYAEMVQLYLDKYNIETTPSMWGNWRRRRGLERRYERDDSLIPWHVRPEHRARYAAAMLRAEGRRRAGMEIPTRQLKRLETWLAQLQANDAVVHYEPDTEEGFFYVPRRPGIDTDIIRKVDRVTTPRRRAD